MWFRSAAILGLVFALSRIGTADAPKVYSRALPPDRSALDRLNLKQEWSVYLPIASQRDSIEMVQTFDDQLFVQTRTGMLIAIDARSGKILWSAALGNGGFANVYPVAVNAEYVFAAHVTRMYAFYRYSGVVEFTVDLGTPPTAGLAADNETVYATLMTRPGASGVERIAAYTLPNPIAMPDPGKLAAVKPGDVDRFVKTKNPVDELTQRYPVAGVSRPQSGVEFEPTRGKVREAPIGGMAGSRTPSLAATTQVTPPYVREGTPPVVSLVVVPSLRQPYRFRDEAQKDIQRTPSLSTIPPSVAAALALTDLRPKGIEPKMRWEMGMTRGLAFGLAQTPSRIWAVANNRGYIALSKTNKAIEVSGTTFEDIAAAPAQAGTIGYAPLGDGTLIAVDLATGNRDGGLNINWQANIGGVMNRTPAVTDDSIFAAGDNSGVARIDRATGIVEWRTPNASDRVVGINRDFVYIQNRQGKLQVFDLKRGRTAGTAGATGLAGNWLAGKNTVNFASDGYAVVKLDGTTGFFQPGGAKITEGYKLRYRFGNAGKIIFTVMEIQTNREESVKAAFTSSGVDKVTLTFDDVPEKSLASLAKVIGGELTRPAGSGRPVNPTAAAQAARNDERIPPLTEIDMSSFNVPIVNTVSDRLYFAADNGLLICLRDASPKYAAPVRIAPEIEVNQSAAPTGGKAKEEPKAEEPKKEEPKKEEPKKEEPKKDDAKKDDTKKEDPKKE